MRAIWCHEKTLKDGLSQYYARPLSAEYTQQASSTVGMFHYLTELSGTAPESCTRPFDEAPDDMPMIKTLLSLNTLRRRTNGAGNALKPGEGTTLKHVQNQGPAVKTPKYVGQQKTRGKSWNLSNSAQECYIAWWSAVGTLHRPFKHFWSCIGCSCCCM